MLLGYLILGSFFFSTLWAFFRFSPRVPGRAVTVYNAGALVAAFALGGGYAAHLHGAMAGGADAAWWPVIAPLVGCAIAGGALAVLGGLRHFVFFRREGPRGP